jgi:hypothetical protein
VIRVLRKEILRKEMAAGKNEVGKYIMMGIIAFVFVYSAMRTAASNARYYDKRGRYPRSAFKKKSKGVKGIKCKKRMSRGPYLLNRFSS